MTTSIGLTERSPELRRMVEAITGYQTEALHTGGGCWVLAIDLEETGRMMGPFAYLTREDDWILGFYSTPVDDGYCIQLMIGHPLIDDPLAVATNIRDLLSRIGLHGFTPKAQRGLEMLKSECGYHEDDDGSVDVLIDYKDALEAVVIREGEALDRIAEALSEAQNDGSPMLAITAITNIILDTGRTVR